MTPEANAWPQPLASNTSQKESDLIGAMKEFVEQKGLDLDQTVWWVR
jgi:hypothetical protein